MSTRVSLCALLVLLLSVAAGNAQELAGQAKRAAQSGNLTALQAVVRDAAEILGASPSLPAARLEDALAALQSAQSGLVSLRDRREQEVGEDEEALDALYGSAQWLQMDHLSGEIDYWRGWVLYRLGHAAAQRGESRTRQRGYYQQALRAFGRALPRVRDPAVGRETLLAVASLQRGLGDTKKARATLSRIATVFEGAPAEFHQRVRLERARTAAAEGDLTLVLKESEGADSEELQLLRLEALLGAKDRESRGAAVAQTARALLGGPSAAQATAHLAAAALDAAFLEGLKLGPVGSALAGLAAAETDPRRAASLLGSALQGSAALPGLHRDVVSARHAEAEYRAGNFSRAYAAAQSFRQAHPDSKLRPDVARLAYDAARAWQAESGSAADRAVADASRWVARDAPDSAEAGEVAVHRALRRAAASADPDRAIRILERVSKGAAGAEAVELQKAFLLSAKLQSELERALQEAVDVRRPAGQLRKALRSADAVPAKTKQPYRQELGLARARLEVAEGKATRALKRLLTLRDDFETTRTRLVALWRVGRHADAQDRARRMLEAGPGAAQDRWQLAAVFAAVAPEQAPNAAIHAKLLSVLRAKRPAAVDPELAADLTLREAEASSRAGDREQALRLLEETLQVEPRALGTLYGAAALFESLEEPDRATVIWHRASQLVPPESDAWAQARVGVARTLRNAPGKAQDGCAVAASLLASGRSFNDAVRAELSTIAGSCPG